MIVEEVKFSTDQFGELVAVHKTTGNKWYENWARWKLTSVGKDGENASSSAVRWAILKAAASLETCRNCTNCADCKDCVNCVFCYDCKDCELCVECTDCDKCYKCINCVDCADLKDDINKIGEPAC